MFFLVNAPSDLRKIKACLDDRIIAVCVFALSKGDFDAPDILSGLFRVDCGTINTEEAGTLVFSGVPAFFVKCPSFHTCPDACSEHPDKCGTATFDKETSLQEFQQSQLATLNAIASLTAHKKAIEEQEKTMKAALYDAMVKFGIKKFESDVLNLTLVEPTTSTSIDAAKLKKKYPAIAAECSKSSAKAGYVKITLKGGEK